MEMDLLVSKEPHSTAGRAPGWNRTDNASLDEGYAGLDDDETFYFYLWSVATPFLFSLIAGTLFILTLYKANYLFCPNLINKANHMSYVVLAILLMQWL